MKRLFAMITCLATMFSFTACNNAQSTSNLTFSKSEKDLSIVASDGTEYTCIGIEGQFWSLGKQEHIYSFLDEQESLFHLANEIKTGMYSVNGKRDVLIRYFPENEFAGIYAKSDLLKKEITLENCIRFEFVRGWYLQSDRTEFTHKGIKNCKQFLNEVRSGQTEKEAELYGRYKSCYLYGYAYGIVQENLNVVILLDVWSYDDKAYSISIDGTKYVLPEKWMNKLLS